MHQKGCSDRMSVVRSTLDQFEDVRILSLTLLANAARAVTYGTVALRAAVVCRTGAVAGDIACILVDVAGIDWRVDTLRCPCRTGTTRPDCLALDHRPSMRPIEATSVEEQSVGVGMLKSKARLKTCRNAAFTSKLHILVNAMSFESPLNEPVHWL